MAKRPRYHFLKVVKGPQGRSLVTLAGQSFGINPVIPGIIVKDLRGRNAVSTAKRKASVGDVFYTTTLKDAPRCYRAGDIHPLKGNDNLLYADAQEVYESFLKSTNR